MDVKSILAMLQDALINTGPVGIAFAVAAKATKRATKDSCIFFGMKVVARWIMSDEVRSLNFQ